MESDAGDPFRVQPGYTGDSVTDVVVTSQGGAGQDTVIQFRTTTDQGATSLLPTMVTIPPGASGSGTGDVTVQGNPSVNDYAKWSGPTAISGQTGVPEGDITGLSINGNTDLSDILTDLDGRNAGVADVSCSESGSVVLVDWYRKYSRRNWI